MTETLDAAALFRRLHEAEVRYVVVGGFAVIAHGFQRRAMKRAADRPQDRIDLEGLAIARNDV